MDQHLIFNILNGYYVVLEKKFKLRIVIFTILMRWLYKIKNIYFHDWINKVFSEENKVPRTLSEAIVKEKLKRYKIVFSFSLCIQLKTKRVDLVV